MTNPDNVIEKFYEDLRSTIETTPKSDKLIILETSMQGLVLTGEPGKACLVDMASESVTTMASSYSKPVLSSSSSSPILSFNYLIVTGHHGCTLVLNNGIC